MAIPSWKGFYAGLNAGGLFWGAQRRHLRRACRPRRLFGTGSGFVGGGAGYNYLFGPVLFGGEIDFRDRPMRRA